MGVGTPYDLLPKKLCGWRGDSRDRHPLYSSTNTTGSSSNCSSPDSNLSSPDSNLSSSPAPRPSVRLRRPKTHWSETRRYNIRESHVSLGRKRNIDLQLVEEGLLEMENDHDDATAAVHDHDGGSEANIEAPISSPAFSPAPSPESLPTSLPASSPPSSPPPLSPRSRRPPRTGEQEVVMLALDWARRDPFDSGRTPIISKVLEMAVRDIWRRINRDGSFVMSPDEYAVFNFFQTWFEGQDEAVRRTAQDARRRFWDVTSA